MYIIIDAYNLLKSVQGGNKLVSSADRHAFIEQLSRYAQAKKHTIFLVFDGFDEDTPAPDDPQLSVIYAGYQSADEYIEQLFQECARHELLLVSSDRTLNKKAATHSIPSIDSLLFFRYLK